MTLCFYFKKTCTPCTNVHDADPKRGRQIVVVVRPEFSLVAPWRTEKGIHRARTSLNNHPATTTNTQAL